MTKAIVVPACTAVPHKADVTFPKNALHKKNRFNHHQLPATKACVLGVATRTLSLKAIEVYLVQTTHRVL